MLRTYPTAGWSSFPRSTSPLMPESLERRLLMAADAVRSYDGSGNNLQHPDWGSAGATLVRMARAEYADGASAPAGSSRPSARAISNVIAAHPEEEEILSQRHLAAFAYLWGQFIDHDLDLTTSASPTESFNVAVPTGDPQFDPTGTGTKVIGLNRSKYASGTGVTSPRQQVNDITSFIDGSMVYGSDATRAAALRTLSGGRLKTSDGNLLPYNTMGLSNANDAHIFSDDQLFAAGDVRANENIELTAIHTLFMREHNRLADRIAAQNPTWGDERVYQAARRLVVGEIQSITFNEFLPALLGRGAVPQYTGYKPWVNPAIATEFSTAAFRLGHSMLADDVEFLTNDADDVRDEMPLSQAFFNPPAVSEFGIDPILKYLASSNAEEIDNKVVDGVRNFLFGPPGAGGFDLASLNIQRGRDHGLADYNDTRAALGLGRVTRFDQISSDPDVQQALRDTYGNVNDIDLWVGGLAEDHVSGSSVGRTFQRILVDQFSRVRDGDRFWYERDLSSGELTLVRNSSLTDVIKRNTTITNLQDNAFLFDVQLGGRIFYDRNGNGQQDRFDVGLPGITLQLIDDESGETIDTTRSGSGGTYRFTGVQVGDYSVRPVLGAGVVFTTDATRLVDVTRGQTFANLNFGVRIPGGTIGQTPGESLDQSDVPVVSDAPTSLDGLTAPDELTLV